MNNQKLSYFKDKLLEEKSNVVDTINKIKENNVNKSMKNYYNELSLYDNHPADIGTETFMMEQEKNLRNNHELILNEIDNALDRIENGTYGKCKMCGNNIEEERLEILPYVKTCSKCKNDNPSMQNMIKDRPIEEDVLKFPFGRTKKDNSEENFIGTDGEDLYQSVAEFNHRKNDPSFNTGDEQGVYDEDEPGCVEEVEQISNNYYKKLLED